MISAQKQEIEKDNIRKLDRILCIHTSSYHSRISLKFPKKLQIPFIRSPLLT